MSEIQETNNIPDLVSGGQFAMYKTPTGGLHLVLQVVGEPEPRHIKIPKAMLAMMSGRIGKMLNKESSDGLAG